MRLLRMFALLALAAPSVALAARQGADVKTEVAQIERVTQQIRSLGARHPVKAVFPSANEFAKAWSRELRQDQTDTEIELNRRESVLLGLLSKGDNLRHLLLSSSADQVAGFYDYHRKVLYVRNDSNRVFGPERYVIAHEYTHALQDQHYDLLKLLPDQFPLTYRNSDAVGAHHALIEGDAVNTQTLFIHQTYSKADLKALIALESAPNHSAPLPTSLLRQFLFPYTTGVDFVTGIYRAKGMAGIDAAFQHPPSSTYVIMHPSAYAQGWKPVKVTLHGVTGFSDWQQLDDDVFGAFGYNLLLWQTLSHNTANKITDSYRGDRYLFLEKGKENAMLFKSVWTSHLTAKAAESTLLRALKARSPHSKVTSGSSPVFHAHGLAVYFHVNGHTVTMACAPTTALATQLGTAPES